MKIQKPSIQIFAWTLVLAWLGFQLFWKWSGDNALIQAKKEFAMGSYAIGKRVFKEFDIYSFAKVDHYVDMERLIHDPVKGWVRHFVIGKMDITLYFPQSLWEQFLTEGKGNVENSGTYRNIRTVVTGYYDGNFSDPRGKRPHYAPGITYKVHALPEPRSREELDKELENQLAS